LADVNNNKNLLPHLSISDRDSLVHTLQKEEIPSGDITEQFKMKVQMSGFLCRYNNNISIIYNSGICPASKTPDECKRMEFVNTRPVYMIHSDIQQCGRLRELLRRFSTTEEQAT
jgi:hypothetical protein